MKFGYFDDANKEYVITSPRTPYPWINYLGTQEVTASTRTLVFVESQDIVITTCL